MINDIKKLEALFFQCRSLADAEIMISECGVENAMVSTHDESGIYTDVSKTCKTFIGYTRRELIGNSSYDYFHPDDFQTILKSHAKVTIRPEIDHVDYRIRMPDGKYREVSTLSRLVVDPAGPQFILALTFERQ
ncbi:MAG: PAS domain-containing protein [Flavobacteriales bacterium]|nr:PAS domain-containing protein [Flavobacteriales bacterium]